MDSFSDAFFQHPLGRLLRALVLMGQFLLTPAVLVASTLLLVIAETNPSRLLAVGILLGWLALLLLWLCCFDRTRRLAWFSSMLLGFVGALCLFGVWLMRPSGSLPEQNFSSHYSGSMRFDASSISNLVPEMDQLKFGMLLVGGVDPFLAQSGTGRLRRVVLDVYRELQEDRQFREVGSVLGACYDDILIGQRERLHYYRYVPRGWKRERYPVLIFLHGSMGNFKGYSWVLKDFADRTGIAVISPTYGMGNWELDPNSQVLREVMAECEKDPELDLRRPLLGGISNGGGGVTRAIANGVANWRGVFLISPVLEEPVMQTPEFMTRARGLPILILHGETDDRIPISLIQEIAAWSKTNGALISETYYPDEDHFLLFSQPVPVVDRMVEWVEERDAVF